MTGLALGPISVDRSHRLLGRSIIRYDTSASPMEAATINGMATTIAIGLGVKWLMIFCAGYTR